MKISVILIIRDRDNYIKFINELFTEIEQLSINTIQFEYFIYENNSKDKTVEEIEKFYEKRSGLYLCENIDPVPKIYRGAKMERGIYMAKIRNKIKDIHGELYSDYTILLDSDVVFNLKTIYRLITTLKNGIVMAGVYSTDAGREIWEGHYYDTLAHISKDGIGWKQNGSACYFDICKSCKKTLVDKKVKFRYNMFGLSEVNSCFGGLAILETNVYNKVRYGKSICEHHSFCNEVRKYGKIVINPIAKAKRGGENIRLEEYRKIKKEMDRHIL